MTRSVVGVLLVDAAGRTVYAEGVGTDPRLTGLAADPAWRADLRARRLIGLDLDHVRHALVAVPTGDGAAGDGSTVIVVGRPHGDAVFEFISTVDFAYDIFHHLLTDPFDGMTVVDRGARMVYMAPIHESFFGIEHGASLGLPVKSVIENTRLDRVVRTGKAEIGEIQHMGGTTRIVTRTPIRRDGAVVGAIGRVMFRGPEQLAALSRRVSQLESEVEFYRREAEALRHRTYGLESIVGESASIERLRHEIVKVAPLEMPVLIVGESGTGKEHVAHALHRLSARRDGPLVMVNAAALPESLVEAELFGHEAGAFTGASRKGRKGKFEQAGGGSILLDEIGEMPPEMQVKLLRVLQDHIVERIGSERPRQVDFRLITATNRDLPALIETRGFRLDLFYRISSITIRVPPLRERLDDIPLLLDHFLSDVAARHRRPVPRIADDVPAMLAAQSWPGNVRQLRHEVERAFVFAEGDVITPGDFSDLLKRPEFAGRRTVPEPALVAPAAGETLRDTLTRIEDALIRGTLEKLGGNKKRVAETLGISRSYLYKKLDILDT